MIKIVDAEVYSINNGTELAYELTYSDGNKVRAVKGTGFIRKEYYFPEGWKLVGKPYVIVKNRNRVAEKIVKECRRFYFEK